MTQWAREHAPHVDSKHETEQFIDYWQSKAGRDALKVDWVATWRNAMRRAEQHTLTGTNGHKPGTDENIRRLLAGTGTTGPNLIALPGGTP
jgi:hypothetical protein